MKLLHDYNGLVIRLTDERLAHIREHPEMVDFDAEIGRTVKLPQYVVRSPSDEQAVLYYRYYTRTMVGEKFLCVVVKVLPTDAFVITAYLTDKVKKGLQIWPIND